MDRKKLRAGDIARVIDPYSKSISKGTLVKIMEADYHDGHDYVTFTLLSSDYKRVWKARRFERL